MGDMFRDCPSLAFLDLSGWDTAEVTYMGGMFRDCPSLASLDLSGWDTSRVTDMEWMFFHCTSLASLDLSGFDTSRVTDMELMFYGCSSLASLDLSRFDTSRVTNMTGMFYGCSSLASLDLSGWDTSQVTMMASMFAGCSSLPSLDLSGWDTSGATVMSNMFSDCSSLASLDLSGWDTSGVTHIPQMFSGCSSLASLDLSGWDTSRVTMMANMFSGCSSLASLDLSGWDTLGAITFQMFSDCSSLASITAGKGAGRMLSSYPSGFPAGRDGKGWFSARDRRWFTVDEISSGRQGIADTYTTYETGGGSWTPKQGDSRYRLGSVVMVLNESAVNVLSCERTIDVIAGDTTFTLKATPLRHNEDVAGYRLYQRLEDKKAAGSGGGGVMPWNPAADGSAGPIGGEVHEIAAADAAGDFGTISCSQFKDPADRNSRLYVRMVDAAGNTLHEEQVFISVKNSMVEKSWSISLVPAEMEFDFGDSFPFLKSMKLPVAKVPVTVKLTEDGKYQIGVNFDINDKKNDDIISIISSDKLFNQALNKALGRHRTNQASGWFGSAPHAHGARGPGNARRRPAAPMCE